MSINIKVIQHSNPKILNNTNKYNNILLTFNVITPLPIDVNSYLQ
jgi:hypothetical protein